MNLKDLKKEIPYKWRVQSFSRNKPSGSCVAYIDARDVMDLLDEVVGPDNWQDKYEFIGNKIIAGIGIKSEGNGWVWKYDTGTAGNIEGEKSTFSDAFKRAAVKWGIGRFLYGLEIRYVSANETKTATNYPYPIDEQGKRIWDLTEHFNKVGNKKPTEPKAPWKTVTLEKQMTPEDFNKNGLNIALGNCEKCGAPNIIYKTSGKTGCSKYCWKGGSKNV